MRRLRVGSRVPRAAPTKMHPSQFRRLLFTTESTVLSGRGEMARGSCASIRSQARAVACAAATALDALVREAQRADEGRRLETAGLTRSLFPCWYAIWFFGLAAFLPELAASAATRHVV